VLDPIVPGKGWAVLHLLLEVDHAAIDQLPEGAAKDVVAVLERWQDEVQLHAFTTIGHKGDVLLMALSDDLTQLRALQTDVAATAAAPALRITWSFLSQPEGSEPIHLQQDVQTSVVVIINTEQICDSTAIVEFGGSREEGYRVSVEYTQPSHCQDWSGAQAVLLSFSEPVEVAEIEVTSPSNDMPVYSPSPAPAARRFECVEVLVQDASSDRELGIFVTDHSDQVARPAATCGC
jgi:hypothetical protein